MEIYHLENIKWDLSMETGSETYEELCTLYNLPPHLTTAYVDKLAIKDYLLEKYLWPVISFTVIPEVSVSLEFSVTESFSFTDLCADLEIHPLDIESIYIKYMTAHIKMKNGARIEHDMSADLGNDPDYKWPIHCHVYDADGNLLREKQHPTTLPLAWSQLSADLSSETSPSPSNSKGDKQ